MKSHTIERGSRERGRRRPDHRAERELLIDLLLASRNLFVECVGPVPAEDWQSRANEGPWSVAECAEHIVLSERALREFVIGLVATTAPRCHGRPPFRGKAGGAGIRGRESFLTKMRKDSRPLFQR